MGFLTDIVVDVRRDLERRPLDESALMARSLAMPPTRDFAQALRRPDGPAIIAEIKRASPSSGPIADADPGRRAAAYARAGAAAISVLTEPRHFDGSLADLRAVRLTTTLPVLRKDFLIHPAQLMQARAEGADAVLLIATCLSELELTAMLGAAKDLELETLVEAFGDADLERALASGARVVGVNARDLESLAIDEGRALDLLSRIPDDRVRVFESGITCREQVVRAVDAGASAMLVGEALMRADDPVAKMNELLGRGA